MLNSLPNELKLIITDQLDDLSYFCLRTALCQNHGQMPSKLYTQLIQQNYSQLEWFLQHKLVNLELFAHFVVRQNKLEVLRWLHAHNYLKNSSLLAQEAAAQGHLKMVEWLYQNNFTLNIQAVKAAIRCGQFKVMNWLLQNLKVNQKLLYAYAINCAQFSMANQLMS